MNSELNTKLEELTKTLEKIGFKELKINIYQHDCTKTQAEQLMESVSETAEHKSYHGEDDPVYWVEANSGSYPNSVRFYCFYTPDEEVSQ